MQETLGEAIKRLRQKADVSLREFASRLGHTASHQSDIEHGRRMPSDDLLRRIADALGPVGAKYEDLKRLDSRLDLDLKLWVEKSPGARAMLRESKASRKPVDEILTELRRFLKKKDKEKGT